MAKHLINPNYRLNDKISLIHAFGIEVIITFLLAFTVYACIDKKRKDLNGSFPLAIGWFNFYTFIHRKTFRLIKIICKYLLINLTRVNYNIFLGLSVTAGALFGVA